jgi:hypothetical protein
MSTGIVEGISTANSAGTAFAADLPLTAHAPIPVDLDSLLVAGLLACSCQRHRCESCTASLLPLPNGGGDSYWTEQGVLPGFLLLNPA